MEKEEIEEVVQCEKIACQGALFPAIDPLLDLLSETLQREHEKMVQLFCSLLVIQAERCQFPWCDVLVFVPRSTVTSTVRRCWERELVRFFHASLAPSHPENLQEGSVIYLIDWYVRSKEVYEPLIEQMESLYPHTFVLLALFT